MELTPERFACLKVIAAEGGTMSHEDERLAPFSDDKSTLTTPDVFNQCHDAGWLRSSHNQITETSVARITPEGYEALKALGII